MRLRKKSPPTVSIEATVDLDDETNSPTIDLGGPDLMLDGSVDRVSLERCIERLPAGYRAIFLLHPGHGYQHNQIAQKRGRPYGGATDHLHQVPTRLRVPLSCVLT